MAPGKITIRSEEFGDVHGERCWLWYWRVPTSTGHATGTAMSWERALEMAEFYRDMLQ